MKRDKEIRFRLTPEEKSTLVALARQEETSQSAFVRRLIQMEAKKQGTLTFPSRKKNFELKERVDHLDG